MRKEQDFLGFNEEEVHQYEETYWNFQQSRPGLDLTYYGNWQRDFGKLIIELADLEGSAETILDVGCGTAINLKAINELEIFTHLIGIDRSNHIITKIIPTLNDWGSSFEFYATQSHDMPMIENNQIDLLICTHTLEHIIDEETLDKTLKEFKRIIHEDSKIVIIIPVPEIEPKSDNDHNNLHRLLHTKKWWSKTFSKYFKSESFKANVKFKNSELKPNRKGKRTFYEEYKNWAIFRLIQK